MTKTGTAADKRAVKALPALRASLCWYKRATVKGLMAKGREATSPKMAAFYFEKARKYRACAPVAFRAFYTTERVREINMAPLAELAAVTKGSLIRLSA